MKRIWGNYITSIVLLLLIFGFGYLNRGVYTTIAETLSKTDGNISSAILQAQNIHKENFYKRNEWINLYGIVNRLLDKRIIGDFEYVRDNHGIMQRFSSKANIEGFLSSVKKLENYLEKSGTPLVYIALPDKTMYLGNAARDQIVLDGQISKDVGTMIGENIDCIDVESLMLTSMDAPTLDEFYFKTDVHCSTYGEYWMTKELVQHLEENYQLGFPNKKEIFDLNNYSINSYAFLGNTARSAGKYFVGLDEFQIYKPNFKTSFTLNNPSASETKVGDFENVILNGYENRKDISEYMYWVTNFGRFMSPHYEYINHMMTESAPSVLVICDSVFMRGFSYLTLVCQKVTVLDSRFFNETDYLANELQEEKYDAVVVVGNSVSFYNNKFESEIFLPDLPNKAMISEEEYGEWIANQGICLDTYNDVRLYGSTISIDSNATSVKLYGWAADFYNDEPFQELYLQVGEILMKCNHIIDRTSVVDYFGKESLLKTGFQITFPTSYLMDSTVTEISFIGVSADGQYLYEPVVYQLEYT